MNILRSKTSWSIFIATAVVGAVISRLAGIEELSFLSQPETQASLIAAVATGLTRLVAWGRGSLERNKGKVTL